MIIGFISCCIWCCIRKKKNQLEVDPEDNVVELHPEKGKQTDAPSEFELQDQSYGHF